ncbi:hypothetical protein ABIE44_000352 [Marmoricola sp. OAE513]|uniref:hypothetical protein n=1 Tax=Marmoricola sp. OAE513 TaxID=2817894 RepID=UPI001AEA6E63
MRGIFFDEDAARDVERQLAADGYEVEVARERYAGEDDDEDHPWAVLTDAPAIVLELLVDQHDGWLDDVVPDAAPPLVLPPAALPDSPKRLHRNE